MPTIRLHTTNHAFLYEGQHANPREALEYYYTTHNAIPNGLDLQHLDLRDLTLDGAQFDYIDFRGSQLSGANLSEATFSHCLFDDSLLHGTCFCYSRFHNCSFLNTEFAATDLSETHLMSCHFSGPSALLAPFSSCRRFLQCTYTDEANTTVCLDRPPVTILGLGRPLTYFGNRLLCDGLIETPPVIETNYQ